MSTIMIWMSPEPGHILPTIKLAIDLVGRGHRVLYQTCGRIAAELQELTFPTVGFFDSLSQAGAARSLHGGCPSAKSYYRSLYSSFRSAELFLEAFRSELAVAVKGSAADALLIDGIMDDAFHLNTCARLGSICRVIRIYTHLPYRILTEAELAGYFGKLVFLAPEKFELPWLRHKRANYSEGSLFTLDERDDFPWSWLDSTMPCVYCSFGSQTDEYSLVNSLIRKLCVAARQLRHVQFVINSRSELPLDVVAPPNMLFTSKAPQMKLLERSAVMVGHGGFGSIKQCIAQAVPMLLVPQEWDQPMNAERVAYHGLGISLPNEDSATPQMIVDGLQQLLGVHYYRESVAKMREVFVASEQSSRAAEVCEMLIAEGAIA